MKLLVCTVLILYLSNRIVINFGVSAQANFATHPSYHGQRYTTIPNARGLLLDETGDILVVSRPTNNNNIQAIYESGTNVDGSVNVCKVVIVNATATGLTLLNHGIAYSSGYLYASSPSTIYRWPYVPGSRTLITTPAQIVINDMPIGGHVTRTLIFDSEGLLYVSVGSLDNIDANSDRSRIRRFNLTGATFPIDFDTGLVFADGLRNEVGLAFDKTGILWGVENGAGDLFRDDLGGNIHNGNPAEELNRFDRPIGQHYGYPFCFTTDSLIDYNPGTQFYWPNVPDNGTQTDAWCRNISNNNPPVFPMPAHQAPLGIEFYNAHNCSTSLGAFPCESEGDAIIAFHGGNTDIRVGFRVAQYVFNKLSLHPTGENINIIYEPSTTSCTNANCFRPVNAIFDKDGHLIVSVDNTGEIFRVYYNSSPPAVVDSCATSSV